MIVPSPFVSVKVPDIQLVGDSLTLNCSVTTVRGITSTLDIVWSSNGTELQKAEGVMVKSITHTSMLFINYYTISKVSTTDEGRSLQCEVNINGSTTVMVTEAITLHVTGECMVVCSTITYMYIHTFCLKFHSSLYQHHHLIIWSFTRSYSGQSPRN